MSFPSGGGCCVKFSFRLACGGRAGGVVACGGRAAVIGLRWPGGCHVACGGRRVREGFVACGGRRRAGVRRYTRRPYTRRRADRATELRASNGGRPADDGACLPRCPGRTAAHVDIQGDGQRDSPRGGKLLRKESPVDVRVVWWPAVAGRL